MYDIITKEEYFTWIDQGLVDAKNPNLKNIQDAFILAHLHKHQNCKIAEIGGGQSRVLEKLSKKNECWNIDKLEGLGAGPKAYKPSSNVRLVRAYVGDFDCKIPDSYFDVVFSISVIEHILEDKLKAFFIDMSRILKPGGYCIHAIDTYLGDAISKRTVPRIDLYLKISQDPSINLQLIEPPMIDSNTVFRCHFASNSDVILYSWNKLVPGAMNDIRTRFQSVSIKAIWIKSHDLFSSTDQKS
jgi:SAM-dependent methyltransferase